MNEEKLSIEIRKILNKHDPARVMLDENLDEYDPEIKEIIKKLEDFPSEKELSEKLYNIFVEYFNEKIAGEKSVYEKIAKEIFEVPGLNRTRY